MNPPEPRRRRLRYETRLFLLTLAGGVPSIAAALWLMGVVGVSPTTYVTVSLVLLFSWLGFAFAVQRGIVFPMQTVSNLLACLREGDTSLRARGARRGDVLGEVLLAANSLASSLRDQRLDAREATLLMQRVMAEIDVAVFAFDAGRRAKLMNRAGERLVGGSGGSLLDASADALGLAACLDADQTQLMPITLAGRPGRWEVRRSSFRLGGLPHTLLVLTDVSRSLRVEERQAWQRLMRVLGHEINNSLAPIKSISASLATLVARSWGDPAAHDDMRRGLEVVASRAEALGRFTGAYSRLAGLPRPRFRLVPLAPVVRRVVGLETRLGLSLEEGPDLLIDADPDQIEQLLINLVKNAVDAASEVHGGARIRWTLAGDQVEILIEDEGPGLAQTANLFVPFFTTKPGGSGIGLVLSRQIAEAHGGSLSLENRVDRVGCVACLRLPAAVSDPSDMTLTGPRGDAQAL